MIETTQQQIIALEKKVGTDAKSPLFAQLANFYLEANRAQDALRLCDAGLSNFPFYTTGHLVKGKTLVALNMRAEARREFEFVLEFLPNNETVTTLLTQMPPSEAETLIAPPEKIQPEIIQTEPILPAQVEYQIPLTPQLSPEPGYSFSEIEQPAVEQQTEELPPPEPSSGPTFFDKITQPPVETTTEDPFGFGLSTPSIETPVIPEPLPFSGYDSRPQEPESFAELLEPPTTAPSGLEFGPPTTDLNIPAPVEEESFEHYALRRKAELSGEDTMSLEDYLANAMIDMPQESAAVPPIAFDMQSRIEDFPNSASSYQSSEELPTSEPINLPEAPSLMPPISLGTENKIEELATKLQSAGKIKPVINFSQKETPPASEQDTMTNVGFVTPTLAEIYAKQGWFDDAIKAYKALVRNKPAEKERFEKRIAELENLKKKNT